MMNAKISEKDDNVHCMTKNYVLKTIYNDENECINDMLSVPKPKFYITKCIKIIEYSEICELIDGYYVAYKRITLSCILFMFNEMKFIHCHSCVMFAMKSMSMCNDYVNYDEIII